MSSSIEQRIADTEAELAQVNSMLTAYAEGIEEHQAGRQRVRRIPYEKLIARKKELTTDLNHLNNRLGGPTFVTRGPFK